MTVTTFAGWVADGRPWHPSTPAADLQRILTPYGYTVYILGNDEHLQKVNPEDHTPYSRTPWPGKQPYPYILACDIMPPKNPKAPSLAQLGAQLFADKQAGIMPWLKYMNWEPSGPAGPCYHDSWEPNWKRTPSDDDGHIHASFRTDFVTTKLSATYDPVARFRGEDMAITNADADVIINRLLSRKLDIPTEGTLTTTGELAPVAPKTQYSIEALLAYADARTHRLGLLVHDALGSSADGVATDEELAALATKLAPLLIPAILQGLRDHPLAPQ